MIDSVRSTVLAVLRKHNYGSIPVQDFNLFAKQSQLKIFSSYMDKINKLTNMQNQMMQGEGFADELSIVTNKLNRFMVWEEDLTADVNKDYDVPSEVTSNNTLYKIQDLKIYQSGALRSISDEVSVGEFSAASNMLITSPSVSFPIHTIVGSKIKVLPKEGEVTPDISAKIDYIRYPKDPKWTYQSLAGGEPVFDQSQGDYQDFELEKDEFDPLVDLILQRSGMSIREVAVWRQAQVDEQKELQEFIS